MKCEWFLMCENEATGIVPHPTLGPVPTCQRCADKLDLDICHHSSILGGGPTQCDMQCETCGYILV